MKFEKEGNRNRKEERRLGFNWTELKHADYILDLELSTGKRKQFNGESCFNPKSDKYDEDYVSFFRGLTEFCESEFAIEEEDEEEDPLYRAFFNKLEGHENGYKCGISKEYGVFSPIIYELDSDSLPVKRKSPKNHARVHHFNGVIGKTVNGRGGDRKEESGSANVKGDRRSDPFYSVKNSDEIDDSYKEFWKHVCYVEGSLIFKYGDREIVLHEGSDRKIDGEIEVIDMNVRSPDVPVLTPRDASPNPRPRKSPRVSSTTDSRMQPLSRPPLTSVPKPKVPPSGEKIHKNKKNSCRSISSLQKRLHAYLRKPYNKREYKYLMKLVTRRKRMLAHKETRSGGISITTDKWGKSYLQHYPDLRDEIKKVQSDRYKVLNLLRMFTFYMTIVPPGPVPWRDDYFKTIMPGTN